MKKFVVVLCAATMMLSLCACGSSKELIMATNAEFPPYEYHEGDAIVGIDVEIAQAIADEMGLEVGDKVKISVGGVFEEIKITSIEETSFFNGIYLCKDLGFDEIFATNGMWFKVSGNAEKIKIIRLCKERGILWVRLTC